METSKPRSFNAYDRPHADLREFIERAEAAGDLLRVKGADLDSRNRGAGTRRDFRAGRVFSRVGRNRPAQGSAAAIVAAPAGPAEPIVGRRPASACHASRSVCRACGRSASEGGARLTARRQRHIGRLRRRRFEDGHGNGGGTGLPANEAEPFLVERHVSLGGGDGLRRKSRGRGRGGAGTGGSALAVITAIVLPPGDLSAGFVLAAATLASGLPSSRRARCRSAHGRSPPAGSSSRLREANSGFWPPSS